MRARFRAVRWRLLPLLAPARDIVRSLLAILRLAWAKLDALELPLSRLQWILLFYLVFGLLYAAATPVFEAHDEIWHFGYVQHLRETGALPKQIFDGRDTIYAQHGSQPPLYYAAMALLTSPLEISDVAAYRQLNPHVARDKPDSWGNKNLTLPDSSLSPWRGAGLAVMSIRMLGILMGAGTVALIYRIGSIVAPQRGAVAFVAAAVTAFNPMFIFVSASVSNDSLAMLLNAATLLLLLRGLRTGFALKRSLAIAALFALSCLAKLTSLALLPALIGVAALMYLRRRDRRGLLQFVASLALCWLLIAGWWHWRNWQLYGEPTGLMMMANIAGPRGMTFDLGLLLSEFQHFRMSYWGLFGAGNIQLTSLFYLLLDLATTLSLVGAAFLIMQLLAISDFAYARYELAYLATLLCAALPLIVGAVIWNTLTRAADGRLLFPLIAVISPLLALGFVEIVWWALFSLRPPNLEFVRAGDAVPKSLLNRTMSWQLRFLGIVALLAPVTVIAGQYATPPTLSHPPSKARQVYAEFGDFALLAYERQDRRYSPGDKVHFKLYWQPMAQSQGDGTLSLTLVDDHNQAIGRYVSYPGAGKLRTSAWQPGLIYPDEYVIAIHAAAAGRYPFDLRVEWQVMADNRAIPATDSEGHTIAPVRLAMGAVASTRLSDATLGFTEIPADAQPAFDESIRLERYLVDEELNELLLGWKTESAPDDNYTVFAHLLGQDGALLAQDDKPPRLPTKYWRWGETYITQHQMPADLPLLDHSVSVGWYLNDGASLPRLDYLFSVEPAPEEADIEQEAVEDDYRDAYVIPWDIFLESLRLTEEAALEITEEPTEAVPTD